MNRLMPNNEVPALGHRNKVALNKAQKGTSSAQTMMSISKPRTFYFLSAVMYCLLIVCIFTSDLWSWDNDSAGAEIFSAFSGNLLFGRFQIYHLFSGLMLFLYLYGRFINHKEKNVHGDKNFLKVIFWLYLIPVCILQFFTVYLKNIAKPDLGINAYSHFFIYLIVVYYIQDVFFKDSHTRLLNASITILEVIILLRAFYSIIKYVMGIGPVNPIAGGIRIGKEPDFTDFFCLLFIIAFARLLFKTEKQKLYIILHIIGIIASSFIAIFSYRRYFIMEILIAFIIIIYLYYRRKNISKLFIALAFFIAAFILSLILFMGPNRFVGNYYIGRLISSLSLVSDRYESEYGSDTGHRAEIEDGWNNVKENWMLGITLFGEERVVRDKTKNWQKGTFVHNAYLEIWLVYGLLGLILFIWLYLKSLGLGYFVFFKLKHEAGLILITFITCQLVKNIVWPTAIYSINVTIVYIFLISMLLRLKKILLIPYKSNLS